MINSFNVFAQKILEGQEGVFFSVKNEVVGHKAYFGVGDKNKANFETGPFPFFSIIDWKGEQKNLWHFKEFYTSEDFEIGTSNEDFVSKLKVDFELGNLVGYASETEQSFCEKIERLQKSQRNGEVWVANFTQNLSGELSEEINKKILVLQTFYNFLKLGKNHCGGVVITKEQVFCSLAPETFLLQDESVVRMFPIKGTGTKKSLENSEKEKSELAMITDLVRNDLGQVCNSVWVERERYLTKEQNFYHARAEVCGRLSKKELKWSDYKKLLPAGSISGAPKHRVIKILKNLESFDRQFYTGTFGIRFSPQKSIFNILIRTLFLEKNKWSFPVGAGITDDSDPQREWQETLDKGKILLDCIVNKK